MRLGEVTENQFSQITSQIMSKEQALEIGSGISALPKEIIDILQSTKDAPINLKV
ncbi:hypothetical protein L3V77_04860 [Vibrio sp. DW001]|uniref:hypothetical protein n=1 Tax=Vibrio sp. DW001 TaxID=2912315 RepID=UPI0023AF7CE3|nr:hypothetical protein [Vibrio sp. DW001]WED27567.1 hypothetical protein L3V77_04860 [Vibrio sp. DW001]